MPFPIAKVFTAFACGLFWNPLIKYPPCLQDLAFVLPGLRELHGVAVAGNGEFTRVFGLPFGSVGPFRCQFGFFLLFLCNVALRYGVFPKR